MSVIHHCLHLLLVVVFCPGPHALQGGGFQSTFGIWILLDTLCARIPNVAEQFSQGKFVVRKTSRPFSAISVDHAHEQNNAIVKGTAGMTDLMQNPKAMLKSMVEGSEIARAITEFDTNCMVSSKQGSQQERYYEHTLSTQMSFARDMNALIEIIDRYENPFEEETSDLLDSKLSQSIRDMEMIGLFQRYLQQTDMKNKAERKSMLNTIQQKFDNELVCQQISLDDVDVVAKYSASSAPGPDGVRLEHINKMEEGEMRALTAKRNDSLDSDVIHYDWIDSHLTPVPKPDKDHSRITAYRIITMQNSVGKLLEKFVAGRLATELEEKNILSSELGSYRRGKVTWMNAAILASDVYDVFERKEETLIAALDLEDAYNRIQYDILMRTLVNLKVDPQLLVWSLWAVTLSCQGEVSLLGLRSAAPIQMMRCGSTFRFTIVLMRMLYWTRLYASSRALAAISVSSFLSNPSYTSDASMAAFIHVTFQYVLFLQFCRQPSCHDLLQ